MEPGFLLEEYLARVGLTSEQLPAPAGVEALATVMAAHSRAIAFENVDVARTAWAVLPIPLEAK